MFLCGAGNPIKMYVPCDIYDRIVCITCTEKKIKNCTTTTTTFIQQPHCPQLEQVLAEVHKKYNIPLLSPVSRGAGGITSARQKC